MTHRQAPGKGRADLRSAPLREAQRNRVSPRSGMTPVSASTPPGKDDAPARERRPPVGTAARSAAKGVYHAAVRMTLNAEVPAEGEPPLNSGSFPAARLRRAVPTRGRRSRACVSLCLVASSREANHPRTRGPSCRPPTAGCADQRSAFPCLYVALHGGVEPKGESSPHSGSFLPPAYGGLCRPEVGVPVPACRSAWWRRAERRIIPALGVLPAARLRRAVPTRGRRSLACVSLCLVASSREANHPRTRGPSCRPPAAGCADQRSAFPCLYVALPGGVEPRGESSPHSGSFLPPAYGGLCRPEVGVPLPACRSAWWRRAERRITPALGVLPARRPPERSRGRPRNQK